MSALASWNDTATREAIESYVEAATGNRVAVFDNDGTLWCEKPMPIQLDFTLRRWAVMAEHDRTLQARQPFKAAYEQDYAWLGAAMSKHYEGDDSDLRLLMGAVGEAFGDTSVEDYAAEVGTFLAEARHPTLGRRYRDCGYQPMVELLRYLEAHDFSTFIASGGDRDFMRPVASTLYGIPAERVIGSSFALSYREDEQGGAVVCKAGIDFCDDGPEKPVRIWSRVGRRPALACGNSNGDVPMLKFADGLRLLLLHDDTEREFNYTRGAEQALAEGWTTISVKEDWATVFADAP